MYLIANYGERRFYALSVATLDQLAPPFGGECYSCLVWDHVGGWSPNAMIEFARGLIRGGCRNAVCAGFEPEQWHNAFDIAFIAEYPEDIRDANFVMTSEHGGESPDDVAFFFVLNTNFDQHRFKSYLLLHLGRSSQVQLVEEAVSNYATPGPA